MNEIVSVEFSSHAKWIMAGEHAVVRGGKALAFPIRDFVSAMRYTSSNRLEVIEHSKEYDLIFLGLLRRAADFCDISFEKISGIFEVKSNLLVGAGLGSSAAICTNVSRFFEHFGFCDDVFELATHLEDQFHGKSSGLDISVAMIDKGIVFRKNEVEKMIVPSFWPHMALTYSGEKSSTFQCRKVVQSLSSTDPKKADYMDFLMNQGAELCESGLNQESFLELRDGIMACDEAFRGWGLYNPAVMAHTNALKSAGAVATKPVGSGLGGFVLSLWRNAPPLTRSSHTILL